MSNSTLPNYYKTVLKNGLNVVAVPLDNKSGVISVDMFYRVGSRNEVMGKSGIAHMLEHLNFKSTKNLKAGEFDEIVKGFGGVNNASTSFDYTHYFIKTATQNLDKSLELFAELMGNLNLKDKEFQPERDVVAEERRWRTDNNPMGYLYFRLFNNAFLYHSYHWTPIGFMSDIQNWSIEDIRDFHKKYYAPNNAYLVVSGDLDKDKLFKFAKKRFGKIKRGPKIPKVYMQEPKQDGEKNLVIYKQTQVEMLGIMYHIPPFNHKDMVAISALGEILTSGVSSRLNEEIVHKQQLANQISAYPMENIDPGAFVVIAVCNPNVKAEDVKRSFLKEIDRLIKDGITKEELEKIKTTTKASLIFGLESSSSVSNLYGSHFIKGDIDTLFKYEQRLNKLTSKEIVEVAKKYLKKENSTTVILKTK